LSSEARDRLLNYYLSTSSAANCHFRGAPEIDDRGRFTSRDDALAWLDAERPNLAAAVGMAADTGRDQVAQELPFKLGVYWDWRLLFDDWLAASAISVHATQRLGTRRREGDALNNLGLALQDMQRSDEAIAAHQEAVAIHRETGRRHSEANALNNLGLALQSVGRFEEAISAYRDAAATYHETGDRQGEGTALKNLDSAVSHKGLM
jgi:tetratricopeptide (TPR) repeat protein